jgi:GMP synthase (glutamine-hydrolysing)
MSVMLFQLGEAPEAVRAEHGGYASWFERAWGGPMVVVDGRQGGKLARARDFSAIVVTGSAASLVEPEPWMDDAAELVRDAHAAGTPLLGVCFGHQLIGRAFGVRVIVNPTGWEMGTCEVDVHEHGDKLFDGLPARIRVNLTHRDMVCPDENARGPKLRVLAKNDATPIQALALGEHIRGIQFHPELSGAVARGYIATRRHLLTHPRDPDAMMARTVDSEHGITVLRNFRRHFADRA